MAFVLKEHTLEYPIRAPSLKCYRFKWVVHPLEIKAVIQSLEKTERKAEINAVIHPLITLAYGLVADTSVLSFWSTSAIVALGSLQMKAAFRTCQSKLLT